MAAKKKIAKNKSAVAIHEKSHDGTRHVVGIGNLRVLIIPEDGVWFAQGVEIDYGAEGDTIEDAKKNFERGFAATIDLHLRMYKTIKNLLVFPPSEVLQEALSTKDSIKFYTQVSAHDISTSIDSMFPFAGIEYLIAGASA